MYRILTGTMKEIERELNKIDKSDFRLEVLVMNNYLYSGEPRLIVLIHIGE